MVVQTQDRTARLQAAVDHMSLFAAEHNQQPIVTGQGLKRFRHVGKNPSPRLQFLSPDARSGSSPNGITYPSPVPQYPLVSRL